MKKLLVVILSYVFESTFNYCSKFGVWMKDFLYILKECHSSSQKGTLN